MQNLVLPNLGSVSMSFEVVHPYEVLVSKQCSLSCCALSVDVFLDGRRSLPTSCLSSRCGQGTAVKVAVQP